ncbi:MAG: D-3-phosphoglycerate dehydrogenase [Verrucomicrobia bacterium]|nr:D-3-phosphoglycerate dehydrogenase [Verrucomicrobiota bacterium]
MTPRLKVVNIDCNFDYTYERTRLAALGIDLVEKKAVGEDEIIAACQEADVVLVEGAKTPMTARVIDALPRTRLIAKYAVGVDNVDLPAATRRGIVVANAADYCTEEVSDHAVALLLGCARRVVSMDRFVHAGNWSGYSKGRPLRRINQLTLGLVGLGRIARATVRKMAGFRLRMQASDPYLPPGAIEPGVEIVPLEQLLRESDLVSVHVPLTAETRGLLNEAAFRLMKPTAYVVNTSRGPVIDEESIIRALREKWIAGAALDVVTEEPLPASSPLREMDQVILTPHCGAESSDSLQHARRTVIDTVEAVAKGYWPPYPVNPKAAPRLPLKPWSEFPQS